MPHTLPFHSIKPGRPQVFHNNTACEEGKRAEGPHWCAGDGGRRLCEVCARLNAEGR
ncbi:MAG: hypothetical protein ABSG64_12215 [Solirubrobacteraceae bacterium]|jgi:hypothetical protein